MANFYAEYPVALGVGTGVTSLNGETGALTLVAGTGISITPVGTNITIANTGPVGTVTSVGLTVPAFLSVAGSPVTSAGVLAVSFSGTALPVANGGTGVTSLGTLSDAGTDGIVVTGGSGSVISNVSLAQHVADATHNGYLSSADWSTFNGKGSVSSISMTVPAFLSIAGSPITTSGTLAVSLSGTALPVANGGTGVTSLGTLSDAGTDGIVVTGGSGSVISNVSLAQHVSDSTHNGYLSSTDWSTFNGKQAAGNYITALTGDGTATGPGSVALTLATVNSNVGSFGSSTAIPSFTVNGKGLVTAASTNVVIAPAGTLTGTTLAANVVTSSLTAFGNSPTLVSPAITGTTTLSSTPLINSAVAYSLQYGGSSVLTVNSANIAIGTTSTIITANEQLSVLYSIASGATGTRAVVSRLLMTSNTALSAASYGLYSDVNRQITLSTTDGSSLSAFNSQMTVDVPTGQTYTNSNANGLSAIRVQTLSITSGGAVSTNYNCINLSDTTSITGNKVGVLIQAVSGGSTGNAFISDNHAFSGAFFINYAGSSTSFFGGPLQSASGQESTGAGTALLSTNCPAVTVAAPFKWIKMLSSDGSTVYFPVWK